MAQAAPIAVGASVLFVADGPSVVQGILLANKGPKLLVAVAPSSIGDLTPRRTLQAGEVQFGVVELAADFHVLQDALEGADV